MKFIDLCDLDARPGLLTVWRPTTEHPSPAHWRPDTRPASYLQEAHVMAAQSAAAAGLRGPSWLATTFELPGTLDAGALEVALLGWIDRHEALRSRLIPGTPQSGGRMTRATVRAGAVTLRRSDVGAFDDPAQLTDCIEQLLDQATDPLAWPSFVFATVQHPGDTTRHLGDATQRLSDTVPHPGDIASPPGPVVVPHPRPPCEPAGSTTVYLGFDHSNVDGYSIFLIAHEIRELYAAALRGCRAELGEVGSYLDFAGTEREGAALVRDDHETVAHWRDFLTDNGGRLPEFPGVVSDGVTLDVPQVGGCDWLLDAEGAQSFDQACKNRGGNVYTGVFASLARSGHEIAGVEDFSALTPFHTRSQHQWKQSVGWYVGLGPLRFAVRSTDSFTEVMGAAAKALERAKAMATVPFPRVTELLGQPLEPHFMVSYMDIRNTPGAREWSAWKAAALRSRRSHAYEVYLWIMRSHDGIYLSYRHPDTSQARAVVPGYLARVARLVREIAGQGEPDVPNISELPRSPGTPRHPHHPEDSHATRDPQSPQSPQSPLNPQSPQSPGRPDGPGSRGKEPAPC
ncbi:condensation domain-containing protein [Streptomyces zagrosensis]|uniref:Condensation domain-containing protein n=1 Tax=Streptomyces zagrosensis TaxID=1042984 RepID=A0A7W9Q5R1_9ACTN|nr:condensation domain-containing protein [Streptomyces zagrosensis]MBB5933951.1 hypothetical protein [Streptomyces zagrosensis]